MTGREIEALLVELTNLYPPPENGAHAITLRSDGKLGLAITVFFQGIFQTILIDEEDFDRDFSEVLADIVTLLNLHLHAGADP